MFEGQTKKVHSLVDKVYSRKNLKLAWERVRANRGASGADRVTIGDFEAKLDENLDRLHRELRDQTYQPQAVRRLEIPKRGAPGKTRPLGIPSVYDRVCQQALVNRLEPIFEKVLDPSSFGYRKGRKTSDALTKIWREVEDGNEWIVDADLKDYFGSVDHEKLMALVGKHLRGIGSDQHAHLPERPYPDLAGDKVAHQLGNDEARAEAGREWHRG